MSVFAIQNFKIRGKTLPTYWNRTFLLLACQTQEKATHNTPFEYLQRVKIEAAKKALEKGNQNINLLMYDAGYNDIKTFREVFKKITGLTPQDYKRKYSRADLVLN
jgi:YesN/AraC family two-component response regulator